jgi:phenol 2-monooxygenase
MTQTDILPKLTLHRRANLIRFGINVHVIDNRSEQTATGRADVIQPKTIETLRQMRLADRLLLKGVKVQDIKFWVSIRNPTRFI